MEQKAEYKVDTKSRYDTWRAMVDDWARHHQAWGQQANLELVRTLALVDIAESLHKQTPGQAVLDELNQLW